MARLKERYRDEVVPALQSEFQYQNPMQVPQLQKIVINIGMGEALQNAKALDAAISDLTQITGQKPVITKARKAIAGFKIRQGYPVGCSVTLRRQQMYEFLDRFVSIMNGAHDPTCSIEYGVHVQHLLDRAIQSRGEER